VLGKQDRLQEHLFVACPLRDLIPDDHVLRRVDKTGSGDRILITLLEPFAGASGRVSRFHGPAGRPAATPTNYL